MGDHVCESEPHSSTVPGPESSAALHKLSNGKTLISQVIQFYSTEYGFCGDGDYNLRKKQKWSNLPREDGVGEKKTGPGARASAAC